MASETLPSELIFEILSRTSLETLEQCKSVSNSWKKIIYEPTFLPLHRQRTNSLLGYFFQEVRLTKYPSAFVSFSSATAAAIKLTWPSDEMKILASCDQGILICQRQICYNKRFYACKPATSQWQALPNPKLRYETDAVAVVVVQSRPLRYIIARLYSTGVQHQCEIFDMEIWRWEKIECAAPYGEMVIPCHSATTTACRFVHWLTQNGNVLTLDVERRCFECSPLPETVRCNPNYRWKQVVEYEGGLGFMCLVEEGDRSDMELWAAGERKKVVDMRAVEKRLEHPHPVEFCNSDVVFMRTADGGGFYNLQNCSFSKVEVPYELRNPHQIFRFRSDAEIVHLKQNSPTTHQIASYRLMQISFQLMLVLFFFLGIFCSYFF